MRWKDNRVRESFFFVALTLLGSIAWADDAPTEKANYDEVGHASWYGNELSGNKTANGEIFNPQAISGAHRTLALPSFVEVTNLETGRTILVRINDRGPTTRDRIIDLSQGAAQQLGVERRGVFSVRVRRVNPPEFERRVLENGRAAAERLPPPPALLNALRKRLGPTQAKAADPTAKAPAPVTRDGAKAQAPPAPRPGQYYIQVGSFSTAARAGVAARQVGGSVQAAGKYWRVRTGPYASDAAAKAALGPVAAKGYRDARITH